jgi:2-polyprenyl-6-methoxyphenol hydroxylase-like FAD-dependent oxidoreductase
VGYATREYRGDPDLGGLSGIVLQAGVDSPVGGLALPVEDHRWLVLAAGMGEHRPPRDVPGYEAHLRALPDPSVADFAERCSAVGDVHIYRRTGNRRHHYERQRDWPSGLLAIGDSFVSFNPVFGQGITVAACEAVALRDALVAGRLPGDARWVMRRFAATAALPWSIATGQDLRQPTSKGRQTRGQALTNAWARELSRLAVHGNARAMDVLTRMYHLVGSPRALLHPALFGAALLARVRGYGPAAGRPSGLAALDAAARPVDRGPR